MIFNGINGINKEIIFNTLEDSKNEKSLFNIKKIIYTNTNDNKIKNSWEKRHYKVLTEINENYLNKNLNQ